MHRNAKLLICYFMILWMASGCGKTTDSIEEALTNFDQLLVGSLDYAKACYQADFPGQAGGFHWAPSGKTDPKSMPAYIEAVGWARRTLNLAGDPWPESFRDKVVSFVKNRQAPDGFFRQGIPCVDNDPRLMGRNLSVARGILEVLGAEPTYPYPSSDDKNLYPELESPNSFRSWLENLDWTKPWGSGDWVGARRQVINGMHEPKRQAMIDVMWDFYARTQSPETGLWGVAPEPLGGNAISGGMKISSTYASFNKPIPRAELLYQTSLDYLLDPDTGESILWIRNPLNTLFNLKGQLPSSYFDDTILTTIIETTTAKLRKFANPNGSFSRTPGRSLLGPYPESGDGPCQLSLGNPQEGSLNSVGSGPEAIRKMLYQLAGREMPGLGDGNVFDDWDGERFNSVGN